MKPSWVLFILLIVVTFFSSCRKDNKDEDADKGNIRFKFSHFFNGSPLITDTLAYWNEAGNSMVINELRYFISEVTLFKSDGTTKVIDDWKEIDYIDIDIPSTLTWDVYDKIPVGIYDSIQFIFGITGEKNKSFMFVNPPEVNMMWPDVLGGGYHYLMINGKWKDINEFIQNYDFHLGIGQLYRSDAINCTDSIYAFVQNYFKVSLPSAEFTISKDTLREIEVIMNVDSWFKTPHVYDFNFWGGSIMQNQPAMQMAKENGFDVFTVGSIR